MKFSPYEKGGGLKGFSHADGVGTKCFEVVFTRKLEVSAILKGEVQKVSTL